MADKTNADKTIQTIADGSKEAVAEFKKLLGEAARFTSNQAISTVDKNDDGKVTIEEFSLAIDKNKMPEAVKEQLYEAARYVFKEKKSLGYTEFRDRMTTSIAQQNGLELSPQTINKISELSRQGMQLTFDTASEVTGAISSWLKNLNDNEEKPKAPQPSRSGGSGQRYAPNGMAIAPEIDKPSSVRPQQIPDQRYNKPKGKAEGYMQEVPDDIPPPPPPPEQRKKFWIFPIGR